MQKFLFSTLLLVSLFTSAQGLDFTRSLDCNWVDPIQNGFLQNHLVFKNKDKELEARVIEQYIKRQDGAKIYLLESDVQNIKTIMKDVFVGIEKKECKFIGEIQNLLVKRTEERAEFVKNLLGKSFKFDKEVEFVYDPDHKPHPKTKDEAEEFLKKFVQFQIANYIATDIKLECGSNDKAKEFKYPAMSSSTFVSLVRFKLRS